MTIGVIVRLHQMIWGPWTLVYFLGAGVILSVQLRFFQISGMQTWWRETVGSLVGKRGRNKDNEKTQEHPNRSPGVSPFQSACTALAATIGTGNIVGVATALTAGGPGALFWMWVSAVLGMATAYTETYLGQKYRYRRADGNYLCGPMIYMERGLGIPALGILYAFLAALASLGMGSMVQSNSVSSTLQYAAGLPGWFTGICVTILAAAVIAGGTSGIAEFSEKMVPVSAGIYLVFCVTVILSSLPALPVILVEIIRGAFSGMAVAGGIGGYTLSAALRVGLSRGVFSNEAGLGSLAILHGAAREGSPEIQGMWAMLEVFVDTIVICTLTGLVILCARTDGGDPQGLDGAALTAWCFARRLGQMSEWLVSGAMISFAFATIIAWYYLGRQTVEYLGEHLAVSIGDGKTDHNREQYNNNRNDSKKQRRRTEAAKMVVTVYTVCYLVSVLIGCICRLEAVWLVSDIGNALMACPNLLTVVVLCKEVKRPGQGGGD
ncbi:MAG: sodium:alanine symporter family protein [Clostridiales bacterium]|nr:sodium:alanine symporter family protein [Clostridiales bacterium]